MEWPTKGGTISVRLVRGWVFIAGLPLITGGSATELSVTGAWRRASADDGSNVRFQADGSQN